MLTGDVARVAQAAADKAAVCNQHLGRFLIRAMMAGFYIIVATILSNVTSAVLYPTYPQFGKLAGAFLFSIAIILIVFVGGELFTGNNMTMAMGAYSRTCSVKDVLKVWLFSYIGNFAGTLILGTIFVGSGASRQLMTDYYSQIITAKLSATPAELLLRGILCNFLVCLAIWVCTRMKTESGKLIVIFCVIMTFVEAGFEHCVANMGMFSIAWMLLGGLDIELVIKSMVFVTIGNVIGGAFLLGLPIKLMSDEK